MSKQYLGKLYQINFHTIFLSKISIWADYIVNSLIYICRSFWFFKQKFAKGNKLRVNFGPLKWIHTWTSVRWLSYCYEEKMSISSRPAMSISRIFHLFSFQNLPFILFPFKFCNNNLQYIYFIQTLNFLYTLRTIVSVISKDIYFLAK